MKKNDTAAENGTTDFGFQQVPLGEKARRVADVFTSVARKYDLMNDLMSFGVHRLWKRYTLEVCKAGKGDTVLDLAGGTGDLTAQLSERVGPRGHVILSDINRDMMQVGRTRLLDKGIAGNVSYIQANAEALPFADSSVDCVTMAFGLRNVTRKERALEEIRRVLRPGGQLLVLEFSRPVAPGLQPVYDTYSFRVLPNIGRWVAGDADSYRYLAESIRMHPDQETLKEMILAAGLERCDYFNLSGGIVALHRAYRL